MISPDEGGLDEAAARSLLSLDFAEDDRGKIDELAKKARHGMLDERESQELNGHLFVGRLIDLLHAKARISLKQQGRG